MSALSRLVRRRFGHRGWHQFTQTHVRAYRATKGRVGKTWSGAPVLLLDHVGRKSGKHMTSPLIYGEDGENLIIVASFGGARRDPAWWPNLKANPETTVNVYGDKRRVRARQATPAEKARLWPKMVAIYAPYERYQRRTERDIPVVILEPAGPPG
jgi:deazaflavin-dependent oxidoreductase (nitroreductase family)